MLLSKENLEESMDSQMEAAISLIHHRSVSIKLHRSKLGEGLKNEEIKLDETF